LSSRNACTIAYFDSSALVKILVPFEDGAAATAEVARASDRVATSLVSYTECRAAIAAAIRTGRMPASGGRQAVTILNELWPSVHRVAVSEGLVQRAGYLAERRARRGFDSIHLASALALGPDVLMVSWDSELLRAAQAEGIPIAPESPSG